MKLPQLKVNIKVFCEIPFSLSPRTNQVQIYHEGGQISTKATGQLQINHLKHRTSPVLSTFWTSKIKNEPIKEREAGQQREQKILATFSSKVVAWVVLVQLSKLRCDFSKSVAYEVHTVMVFPFLKPLDRTREDRIYVVRILWPTKAQKKVKKSYQNFNAIRTRCGCPFRRSLTEA